MKIYSVTILVLLIIIYYCGNIYGGVREEKIKLQSIILAQVKRYPLMEIQDIYKLLHQAALGSEHAVKDTANVKTWLDNEWSKIDSSCSEPVCDTIDPKGEIVRINMRPYKYFGYGKQNLLRGFINTANNYKGTKKDLEKYWQWAVEISGQIQRSKKQMLLFIKNMKKSGYPAVHHSKVYEMNYAPAYRVLMKKEIPDFNK